MGQLEASSGAFDARAVLDIVRAGQAPSDWHVYRARLRRDPLLLTMAFAILMSVAYGPSLITRLLREGLSLTFSTLVDVACLILLVATAVFAIRAATIRLRTPNEPMLVITPSGFLQVGDLHMSASFDTPIRAQVAGYGPGRPPSKLLLTAGSGQVVELSPDPRVGDSGPIVAAIIAAYDAYQRRRVA